MALLYVQIKKPDVALAGLLHDSIEDGPSRLTKLNVNV